MRCSCAIIVLSWASTEKSRWGNSSWQAKFSFFLFFLVSNMKFSFALEIESCVGYVVCPSWKILPTPIHAHMHRYRKFTNGGRFLSQVSFRPFLAYTCDKPHWNISYTTAYCLSHRFPKYKPNIIHWIAVKEEIDPCHIRGVVPGFVQCTRL